VYRAVAISDSPCPRGPSSALDCGVGERSNQPPVGVDDADFVPFDWAFDWTLHDLDLHCRRGLGVEHRPHAFVVERPPPLVDVAGFGELAADRPVAHALLV